MKVCFPFVGDSVGGAHVSAALLIGSLDPSEYEVTVVLHEQGPLADFLDQRGISYELLPVPGYVGVEAGILPTLKALLNVSGRLRSFLKQRGIELVHGQDARVHLTWVLASRLAGCRYVWHQRSRWPRHRTMDVLAHRASEVVCISRFVQGTLPPSLHSRVIENPFEQDSHGDVRSALLEELGIKGDASILGTFGRIVRFKRPEMLIQALPKLSRSVAQPVHLCLFGADQEGISGELLALAESLGVGDRVHLMGFRTPIEPWIAACDVVCALGESEGSDRVVVEAMLAGTAVVAARGGGHDELVIDGESDLLISDEAQLVDALITLLSDTERAERITARAKSSAAARFSVRSHRDAIEDLYAELLR